MAVDFDAWAKNPNKQPVLLADVDFYELGVGADTKYLSTFSRGDFGHHLPIIERTPTLSRKMSTPFGGRTVAGVGYVDVLNADGDFDDWVYHSWGGRAVTLRMGDYTWNKADFRVMFTGVIDKLEIVSNKTLRFHLKDKIHSLDEALTELLFTAGEAEGQVKPWCFGKCFNVTPVKYDATTFYFNATRMESVVQAYVDGAATTVGFTESYASGYITITSGWLEGDGALTFDINGTYATTPRAYKSVRDVFEYVLIGLKGFVWGDIDSASWTAFGAGYDCGIYVDERTNTLDVLDDAISAHLGYYGFNREGKFKIGKLTDPALGTSVLSIDQHQTLKDMKLKIFNADPRYQTTIGYNKRFTVFKEIEAEDIEFSAKDYREKTVVSASKATIQTEYLSAYAPEPENTSISSDAGETDAATEAGIRNDLFDGIMYNIRFKAFTNGYLLDVGDVADITDHRFNLDAKKFVITSIDDDFVNGIVTIEGWFKE